MKHWRIIVMICLIVLTACGQTESDASVFQYKGSLIGDNSAVTSISRMVTTMETVDNFKLQTDKEPYGIELYYKSDEPYAFNVIDKEVHQQSVYLYYLIDNVDYISFIFNNQTIHTERDMYTVDLKALNKIENINEQKVNNYLYETYAP
ncbi:hypothetical protein HMI01_10430 [Halolactibacillus miurensis]|uniref:DUF4825 domain-containing protein n=1 Tax=Halolactibacillus miurensis TaxID=306541 RepID=A0A1I6SJX5_9BACI|nr:MULTISPECIES: DUF4825 domain-containing protein [Halolactibacillus]GEM04055.1 hypothetical protein HMI01_10430 [Halolactibacillus miurensis]SFS77078.1 protein of unknown function [Halolactibacillus miurensis]